jgi:plasmid maintenance system antidote protein VapI
VSCITPSPRELREILEQFARNPNLSKVHNFARSLTGGNRSDAEDAIQAAKESFLEGEDQDSKRGRLLEYLRDEDPEAAQMAELMFQGTRGAELAKAMGRERPEINAIMARLRDLARRYLGSTDKANWLLGRDKGRRWNRSISPLKNMYRAIRSIIDNRRKGADNTQTGSDVDITKVPGKPPPIVEGIALNEAIKRLDPEAAWIMELKLVLGLEHAELVQVTGWGQRKIDVIVGRGEKKLREGLMDAEPKPIETIAKRLKRQIEAYEAERRARPEGDRSTSVLGEAPPENRTARRSERNGLLEHLRAVLGPEAARMAELMFQDIRRAELAKAMGRKLHEIAATMRWLDWLTKAYKAEQTQLLKRLRAGDRQAAQVAKLMLDQNLEAAALAEAVGGEVHEVDVLVKRLKRLLKEPTDARRTGTEGTAPKPIDTLIKRMKRQIEVYWAERCARPEGDPQTADQREARPEDLEPKDRAARWSERNGLFEYLRAAAPEAARMVELIQDRGLRGAELAKAMYREPQEIAALLQQLKPLVEGYKAEQAQLLERLCTADREAARVAELMLDQSLGATALAETMGRELQEIDALVKKLSELTNDLDKDNRRPVE